MERAMGVDLSGEFDGGSKAAKPTINLASTMRAAPLPSKGKQLLLDRKRKTAHAEALKSHIQDFIEYHELQLPKTDEACAKNSRVFPTGEVWRDTVRRQLRLQDLILNISAMHVNASDEFEVTTTLLVYGQGDPAAWDDIKDLLSRSNAEVTSSYTLKPLEEDEDFEWEYPEPLLALSNDLFRLRLCNQVSIADFRLCSIQGDSAHISGRNAIFTSAIMDSHPAPKPDRLLSTLKALMKLEGIVFSTFPNQNENTKTGLVYRSSPKVIGNNLIPLLLVSLAADETYFVFFCKSSKRVRRRSSQYQP